METKAIEELTLVAQHVDDAKAALEKAIDVAHTARAFGVNNAVMDNEVMCARLLCQARDILRKVGVHTKINLAYYKRHKENRE